jgi:hypothetical protein
MISDLFASRTLIFDIRQAVLCHINLQHHCSVSQCDESGARSIRQERELTTLTTAVTRHGDTIHYVVNINSMTNYDHIRSLVQSHINPLPVVFPNPASYPKIREAAILRMNKDAIKKAEKRRQQKGRLPLYIAKTHTFTCLQL